MEREQTRRRWCAPRWILAIGMLGCHNAPSAADAAPDAGSREGSDAARPDDAAGPEPDAMAPAMCRGAPCGGDIVGRWTFSTACAPARPMPVDDCDATVANMHNAIGLEGTVTFGADGFADFDSRPTWRQHIWAVRRCYADPTCARIVQAEPPLVATCAEAGPYCDCTITQGSPPFEMERLPYRVSGEMLEIDTAEATVSFTYCATDEWLSYVHTGGELTIATRSR